ncbi:MAG: S8 family serine peptidase [Phycisphaerales bacterium]
MSRHPAQTTLFALSVLAGAAVASDGTPGDDPLSNQGILELASGADINDVAATYGFTVLESIQSRSLHLVQFEPALTEDQFELLSDPLLGDPDITDSELNHASGDQGSGTQSMLFFKSEIDFNTQPLWGALGLSAANQLATGDGIVIAVIDCGIDVDHPHFAGKIHPGAINLLGTPGAFDEVGNGIDDDSDGLTDEMLGHGTFVAGLASSVAPGAMIMPIRAMNDEGLGDGFTIARAVYHAIEHGADVINLSLGSETNLRVIDKAIHEAADLGIIVIASAGNESERTPEYPAGSNDVGGVAATDLNGVLATFSNFGDHILACAPGVAITGPDVGGWGEGDGTSAAAPLLAGTAALLLEQGKILRYDDFRDAIRKTSIDIRALNPGIDEKDLGAGLLDIEAAVNWPGACFADLAEDDVLNFDDLDAFVTAFLAGDNHADFAEPRGVLNFDDLDFFVQSFLTGCPGDGP